MLFLAFRAVYWPFVSYQFWGGAARGSLPIRILSSQYNGLPPSLDFQGELVSQCLAPPQIRSSNGSRRQCLVSSSRSSASSTSCSLHSRCTGPPLSSPRLQRWRVAIHPRRKLESCGASPSSPQMHKVSKACDLLTCRYGADGGSLMLVHCSRNFRIEFPAFLGTHPPQVLIDIQSKLTLT